MNFRPRKLDPPLFNPFDMRKGEGEKTFLMFLYFFLTITVLYVLKPVRSSLFLEELGSQNLRYVYLGEGVFLLFVTWAYVQLAKILPRKHFFVGVLVVFISNLLIFWWLFRIHTPYLSAFFYIWVACFSITSVTQFWTLANDIFNPQEAKRLFGLIISGGSAGGVLGGILTNRAVQWIKTEDLLLLSCLLLGGCAAVVSVLWRRLPAVSAGSGRSASPIEPQSTRKLFLTSPYLWMLAGVVLFAKVGSTIVDNQFNAVVELHLVGKQAKTAFFGAFSAGLNIVSFLMQLCVTSFSLRVLGIAISLALLPVGLGAASLVTFLFPTLAAATLLKIFDGSMNYSVQQASKEVLYLPLSSSVRYRAKPVIDMLVYRVSKSLGGILIIVSASLFSVPNDRIGILVLGLFPFWIALVWRMRSAYLLLLRHHLHKDKSERTPPKLLRATETLSFLYDEKSFVNLRQFFNEGSTVARKMAASACLVYYRAGKDMEATRRLVDEMMRWEALEAEESKENNVEEKRFFDELLLKEAEQEVASLTSNELSEALLDRLGDFLEKPKGTMALKKEAAEYLARRATQPGCDKILEIFSRTEEHALRFLLLKTLLRMRNRNPDLRWNRPLLKKEILRETELYQNLLRLHSFYVKTAEKKEEFLEVALSALTDESLERLFRALGLLFPGEGIRIIYERLLEHRKADPVRAHAIELLQNLLGPEFYGIVEKIINEGPSSELSEEEAVTLLEQMMRSPDRWLSLIAYFIITESGLSKRWPRLESLVSTRSFESLDL